MIRYLLSQIDPDDGFGIEMGEYLRRDVRTAKVVFVPTTPDNKVKTGKYVDFILRSFEKAGISFAESFVLYGDIDRDRMIAEVSSADVVFLMGGDTLTQHRFMTDHQLGPVLRSFKGVMMGMSAGAINMCKTSVLTPTQEVDELYVYEGLGVVEMSVEVHFQAGNREQVDRVLSIAKEIQPLYCISDLSAIRIDRDNHISIIGDGVYRVSEDQLVVSSPIC